MNFNDQIYYWAHMLDESFGRRLVEDVEGKNINKAEAWLKSSKDAMKFIGQIVDGFYIKNVRDIVSMIRHKIGASRLPLFRDENGNTRWITLANGDHVEKGTCKFLKGICRIYFSENLGNKDNQSKINRLNNIIKFIADNSPSQFDQNLNGMSLAQLEQMFGNKIDDAKSLEREKIKKAAKGLVKNPDYTIVPIASFEDAKKYNEYVSWCVTEDEGAYNSYTYHNTKKFYFALKNGFENIKQPKGDWNRFNEYGMSMLAILIDETGELDSMNGCTCRYNDGSHVMTAEQIQSLLGVDFYETFKPNTKEQIIKAFKQSLGKQHFYHDQIYDALHGQALVTYELIDGYEVAVYSILKNDNIVKYMRVSDECLMNNDEFLHLEDGKMVQGQPVDAEHLDIKIIGCFDFVNNLKILPKHLRSIQLNFFNFKNLNEIPQADNIHIYCSGNSLTSLEGLPPPKHSLEIIGCPGLKDLTGCPNLGKDTVFKVESCNEMTSLKGCPDTFKMAHFKNLPKLKTLDGMPEVINGSITINNCENISNLIGSPKIINGNFTCRGLYGRGILTSLIGAPERINGDFDCQDNDLSSLEGGPIYVEGLYQIKNRQNSKNEITSLKGAPGYIGDIDQPLYEVITGPNAEAEIDAYNEFLKHSDGTKRFGE